jgi:NADH-quinone oxidoreductase subunit H
MWNLIQLLATIVKVLIIVGFVFNVAALLTWVDRRQSAMIQDRVGPNRAVLKIGKFELRVAGLLHTAADGVKFFFKEDFMPPKADKLLFSLAPIIVLVPVLALLAVIPMADTICLGSIHTVVDGESIWPARERSGVCADPAGAIAGAIAPLNVGILYVFAMAGQGIVGAAIAGWSSDNKFSLMGALRAASQMVSYEVAIGLSLVGAMMTYKTVALETMVRWQGENAWGIFVQPLAFVLFFVSAVAESKRIPFDLPEAESELVSGYFTEYSGMKFGMFYFAEYMEVVTSSMLVVLVFLGGWQLPFVHPDGISIVLGNTDLLGRTIPISHLLLTILSGLTFFGKTLAVCCFQAFVRWSLPRFRYDQLMRLGWRGLLPAALLNIFVTGIVLLTIKDSSIAVHEVFKFLADLTQAVVAAGLTFGFFRGIVWALSSRRKQPVVLGGPAEVANSRGGTKETPMQA